jgi:hypothetical protein
MDMNILALLLRKRSVAGYLGDLGFKQVKEEVGSYSVIMCAEQASKRFPRACAAERGELMLFKQSSGYSVCLKLSGRVSSRLPWNMKGGLKGGGIFSLENTPWPEKFFPRHTSHVLNRGCDWWVVGRLSKSIQLARQFSVVLAGQAGVGKECDEPWKWFGGLVFCLKYRCDIDKVPMSLQWNTEKGGII